MLEKKKSNGDSISDIACEDIYANYKNWIKDFIHSFFGGPFAED
jgi:hypothetical protein